MGMYAVLILALERSVFHEDLEISPNLQAVLGVFLGVLGAYRLNTAYARWWEARQLWGRLNNDLRNLALKVQAAVPLSGEERQELFVLLAGVGVALKEHLRGGARLDQVPGFSGSEPSPAHVPAWLAGRLYRRLQAWRREERIDGFTWLGLDRAAAGIMEVCGGCERIRHTPAPVTHRMVNGLGILAYLLSLPWTLPAVWWNPLLAMLAAFFYIGMEQTAEDMEEPFGLLEDDLPLDALCRGIRTTLAEILEASPAPLA